MSIKTKIVLLTFLVAVFVALPGGWLFYRYSRDLLYDSEIRSRMRENTKTAQMVADNLEANDYLPIVNYINKMKVLDNSLVDISIADKAGNIIAHTDPAMIGRRAAAAVPAPALFVWETPIIATVKGDSLGTMVSRYDARSIADAIRGELRVAVRKIVAMGGISLLIGIIPGFLIARRIAGPLRELAGECRKVSSGDLEINLRVDGTDEVAVVAREVRSMVGKLKELDRMKDDFVNNVSHELRSPLASIKSYIEILQSGSFGVLTARQLESIEIIKKATIRLSTFVNNLLDIAKIKSGTFELDFSSANLMDIVSEVVTMQQPLFIEKSIEYGIEGARASAGLACDVDSIKRVVTNLVGNALKFTPEQGKITIQVTGEEGGAVRCTVSDSGPGISADDLPKLFNRFTQVSGSPVKGERKKGTGLGLAISRDIIVRHGGKIWAESRPGSGSSFIFILPTVNHLP